MSSVSCRDTRVGWTWGRRDRAETANFVFVVDQEACLYMLGSQVYDFPIWTVIM